jgi:SAM-dependent methyltransferase
LPRGRALDVACGAGRNALFLAANGFRVDAVDISSVGLERGQRAAAQGEFEVGWHCADLDDSPDEALPSALYDVIVWVRYIHRELMPHLIQRLAPGGVLLCEQHLATDLAVAGPTNPAFRLAAGELRLAAASLRILHYREGPIVDPDQRTVALAQLVAAAPD